MGCSPECLRFDAPDWPPGLASATSAFAGGMSWSKLMMGCAGGAGTWTVMEHHGTMNSYKSWMKKHADHEDHEDHRDGEGNEDT